MSNDFGAKMHGNHDLMAIFGFNRAKWNNFWISLGSGWRSAAEPSGGKEQ